MSQTQSDHTSPSDTSAPIEASQTRLERLWYFIKSRSWRYWLSLRWLPPLLETLSGVALRLGTLALAIFIVVFLLRLFQDRGYLVRPLGVPQSLAEAGYTEEVAALRMMDAMAEVKEIAGSIKTDSIQITGNGDDFSLAVLGVGFSMRSVADQLRSLLGQESKHIEGEITFFDSIYRLDLRMTGYPAIQTETNLRTEENTQVALQHLVRLAAENILLYSDPYRQALLCHNEKRDEEALEAVQYLLRERPEETHWGYLAWGTILEDQNEHVAASEKFKRAVKYKPDFALGWLRLTFSYEYQDLPKEALEAMHHHLELEPDDIWRMNNYGWMLYRMDMPKLADSLFQLAIHKATDPRDEAYVGLSYASFMLEIDSLQKSKALIEKYGEYIDGNVSAIMSRAIIAFAEQDTFTTIQYLAEALELDPQDPNAISANVGFSSMLQDYDRVAQVYRQADWSTMNDGRKYYNLLKVVRAHLMLGQPQPAKAILTECKILDRYNQATNFYLAQACHLMAQRDSTLAYLRTALEGGYELDEEDFEKDPYFQVMLEEPDIYFLVNQYREVPSVELSEG